MCKHNTPEGTRYLVLLDEQKDPEGALIRSVLFLSFFLVFDWRNRQPSLLLLERKGEEK